MSETNNLSSLYPPPVLNDTYVPVFSGLRISASSNHPALKVRGDSEFYDQVNCCDALVVDGALNVSDSLGIVGELNVSGSAILSSDVVLDGMTDTEPTTDYQLYYADVYLTDGTTTVTALCIKKPA